VGEVTCCGWQLQLLLLINTSHGFDFENNSMQTSLLSIDKSLGAIKSYLVLVGYMLSMMDIHVFNGHEGLTTQIAGLACPSLRILTNFVAQSISSPKPGARPFLLKDNHHILQKTLDHGPDCRNNVAGFVSIKNCPLEKENREALQLNLHIVLVIL